MFDYAIKNGLIADGTRGIPYKASVYIKDGRIADISKDEKASENSIDAAGLIVSPGFIDIHSHSDASFMTVPSLEGKLLGGVTFELTGQCGISLMPMNDRNRAETIQNVARSFDLDVVEEDLEARDFSSYASSVEKKGIAINQGGLVGHGTLRSHVAGWEMRQLSPDELSQMCCLLDIMLAQGALGLSLGLIYPPGSFCDTSEIIALANIVVKHDKILAVHMRNENKGVFDAADEMLSIAKETGVKLQISHLKLMGVNQWGRAGELLAKIDFARAQGVRVHCDQYPYCASSSVLTSCLPKWAMDGGYARLAERLKDQKEFERIFADNLPEMGNRGTPDRIIVNFTGGAFPEAEGKTLAEMAEYMKLPLFEAMRQALIRCNGIINCIYHSVDERDMLKIMARTDIATCSDGLAYDISRLPGRPHPRNMSSFVRFLKIVREHRMMPLQDAVYKITAFPAALLGLDSEIGIIKVGYAADITIFNPDTIGDTATYDEPWLKPIGIECVLANGRLVLQNGAVTGARSGKFYRKTVMSLYN